jgi:xylulokinase
VTGQPLTVLKNNHGAPLGNVYLAAEGVGLISDAGGAASRAAEPLHVYTPLPANQERYARQFAIYQRLYPDLKARFADLAVAQLS